MEGQMANDLTVVAPKLLAQGLRALRGMNVMPALVNNDYSSEYAQKGLVVTIPIPSAIAVQDVTPAATPPSTGDVVPTQALVTLNQWKEAPFYLTDKDMQQAMDGVIPMQASEAVKALADTVNAFIFSLYKGIYGFQGTPGTTPFASDTTAATSVRKTLNRQLCPPTDRRMVVDPDAEANALNLQAFQNTMWSGSPSAIVEGKILRKIGFDWFSDTQVPTHTSTVFTAGAATVNGVNAVGAGSTDGGQTGTLSIAKATNSSPLVAGDIITKAGDNQTYVVLADVTLAVGNTSVSIAPANKVATAGGEAVTLKATHIVNLGFHRDAFAFASRPMADSTNGLGNIISSASDPVSGISLRMEISREHKRTRFSYDILYGATLVRRELACRLAG
jgi:hypothetical protein